MLKFNGNLVFAVLAFFGYWTSSAHAGPAPMDLAGKACILHITTLNSVTVPLINQRGSVEVSVRLYSCGSGDEEKKSIEVLIKNLDATDRRPLTFQVRGQVLQEETVVQLDQRDVKLTKECFNNDFSSNSCGTLEAAKDNMVVFATTGTTFDILVMGSLILPTILTVEID